MIALALAVTMMTQDTNTALSPRVRAMLDRFPPPRPGLPSIAIRFSRDTVWLGEQIELVTATWFPRSIRDQLRRLPVISAPSLSGLWSARNQQLPIPTGVRNVGGQLYDLYISWQTIFPLSAGQIVAPAATLTYNMPTSTAYFAPEVAKTFRSAPVSVVVRPIPPALVGSLGSGPTARNLHLSWRGPVAMLRAGSPALVELAISGDGNLTLWPAPAIAWPAGVHVYPEPTLEHQVPAQGLITGEKRFRYTLVVDSAGVLTLPTVTYPYFDPGAVSVVPATARLMTLPILQRVAAAADRGVLTVTGSHDVPWATTVVRDWWALVLLMAFVPLLVLWRPIRRRPQRAATARLSDPEAELRSALGTPVDAGQDHVVAALRLRGVPRDEAEHVHRWLSAVTRRRYGPTTMELPDPPPIITRVIARLRTPTAIGMLLLLAFPLHARQDDGAARFADGDFPGAARSFDALTQAEPYAAGLWRDLGAARWMQHDDIGATAAWLRALSLAPRDAALRGEWDAAGSIPPDVRALAPIIPLNRDELILIALGAWFVLAIAIARQWHRAQWIAGVLCAALIAVVGIRWRAERPGVALVTAGTTLHISPHPATSAVGELAVWSIVRVERRYNNWLLVGGQVNTPGSVAGVSVQGWIPAASVAPIGPLD